MNVNYSIMFLGFTPLYLVRIALFARPPGLGSSLGEGGQSADPERDLRLGWLAKGVVSLTPFPDPEGHSL